MIQSEKMQTYTRLFYVHTSCFSTSPGSAADKYRDIDWKACNTALRKKQAEIIRAYKKKDFSKVFELQQSLTRSFAARALAVRKVSSNKGKNTPGIDKVIWKTNEQKFEAITALHNLSKYKAKPMRRIHTFKTNGALRSLDIPTMFDRAVQTVWYFALIPIAEETADSQSYGFRPYRGIHDCVTYLKLVCSSHTATRCFVLDADIKSFFDSVSHNWLLENIPMDKCILKKFLKAGFLSDNAFEETPEGFFQGGVLSPTIANMTLNGLKKALGEEFLMTRYVDNFIVLGKTKRGIKLKALPTIQNFLSKRGLELNLAKTNISTLKEGFEFLGFLFKEFPDKKRAKGTKRGIFLVQPSPLKVKRFQAKLSDTVKEHKNKHTTLLIIKLNQILRGWVEHYQVSTVTKCYNSISNHLFIIIWKMLKDRYRKVPRKEIVKRHFTKVGNLKWVFYGPSLSMPESEQVVDKVTLFQINSVKMKRHSLCAPLNSFNPENYGYFEKRVVKTSLFTTYFKGIQKRLFVFQKGICPVCDSLILDYNDAEIHHRVPRAKSGFDKFKNIRLVHKECYYQITHTKNPKLLAAFKDAKII